MCALLLASSLLIHASQQAAVDGPKSSVEAAILQMHETARRAHLTGDAALLASGEADQVLNLHDGDIQHVSRDDVRRRFEQVFASVQYLEWSDVEPPVIRVSSDGRMAWMAVKIHARVRDKTGKISAFISSWISTYEKRAGGWLMVAISSAVKDVPAE